MGLHFVHYKNAAESKTPTKLHIMFLDRTMTTVSIIKRWTKELSVMLEKIKGNIDVEKLKGILLMTANYTLK